MTPRDRVIALFEFVRWYTNNLLKDIPLSKYTHQPSPTDNHILWCLGHIAGTDAYLAGVVGATDVKVPDAIQKAFGMNSKPVATGNPSAEEVRHAYESARAGILRWYKEAPESALNADYKSKSGDFFTDAIDGGFKIAWHEGFHAGQIANIRKALHMPPSM